MKVSKIKLSEVTTFFFLFFMIIDPTRNLFHMTEISFIIFIFTNYKKISYQYAIIIILFFAIFLISLLFSIYVMEFDYNRLTSIFLANFFLIIFLFISRNNNIFKYYYIISLIMSFIVLLIGLLFNIEKKIAYIFINYLRNNNGNIMFSESRSFLSIPIISIFYKSSPIIVFALAFSFSKYLIEKRKKYIFFCILLFFNLILSGTRANILAALFIIFLIYLLYIKNIKRNEHIFYYVLYFSFIIIAALTILILINKDASYNVKELHFNSTIKLFITDPIRTFIIGFGPGTKFYSAGYGKFESQTELSYLELVRNYGFFCALIIIMVYLYPIFLMFKNRKYLLFIYQSLIVSYLAYLFIAATNPFLNSSIGYLTLAIFYYISIHNVEKEI